MTSKNTWVEKLKLTPHPEGGYFKETYRNELTTKIEGLENERNLATGIYFLIEKVNFSAFHKIKSDEMWHYYAGDPLIVHMIDLEGNYSFQKIGNNLENNELPQFIVPANYWFASEVFEGGDYSLVGCTVSFGFDFRDFEMANTSLVEQYPAHENILKRLIRV